MKRGLLCSTGNLQPRAGRICPFGVLVFCKESSTPLNCQAAEEVGEIQYSGAKVGDSCTLTSCQKDGEETCKSPFDRAKAAAEAPCTQWLTAVAAVVMAEAILWG